MHRLLCLLLLSILPMITWASDKTDSLIAVLEGLPADTHRVKTLMSLTDKIANESLPQALKYAHEAQDLSTKLNFSKGIFHSAIDLAKLYRDHRDIDNILKYAFIAIEVAEKENRRDRLAETYNVIATGYTYNDEFEMAREYLEKCRSIALEIGDSSMASVASFNIGNSLLSQEKFAEALPIFEETLPLFEQDEYFMAVAICHNNIGICYYGMNQYSKALASYQIAYDMKAEMGNQKSLLSTRQNIAETLIAQRKFAQADELLMATLKTADSLGVPNYRVDGYDHLSSSLMEQGRYQEAFEFKEQYADLKDSLLRVKNESYSKVLRESILFKDQEIEIARLESEKDAQEAKDQVQELVIWVACIFILITLTFIVILFRSNQKRKKANESLQRLNREKDGLLGMVAHDLKAPLNSTLGIVGMLKENERSAEDAQLLSMVETSCLKGVNLIGDLLELNKIESDTGAILYAEIDLGAFLEEKRKTYFAQAEQKDISISIIDESEEGTVRTSPAFLDRILDNLISNAIKFSERGKEVALQVGRGNNTFTIAVSDNGPGFTEEDKVQMYASFQKLSAKPTAGENSTGLGLAIVKSLVSKLRGEISLVSSPGKGATFIVELPS